jgi:hypothetical protein
MIFDKPAHKIQDAELDINRLSEYTLSIMVSRRTIRFCAVDVHESRCLLLEDYRGSNIYTEDELLKAIQELYERHNLLKAGYWAKVQLAFRATPFTWVPAGLFDMYRCDEYLQHAIDTEALLENDTTRFAESNALGAFCIFKASSDVASYLQNNYLNQSVNIYHQAHVFAEAIMRNTALGNLPENGLHVYGEAKYLLIIAVKGGQVKLINQFPIFTPEDFVYFILFALDELQMPPHGTPILLYGEISPSAKSIEILRKYVKDLRFSGRPPHLLFSYQFEEVLDHRYYDLLNMHLLD